MAGKRRGVGELSPALALEADEIRVAELALRGGAILLAPAPQIAAGETAKDCGAARVNALALQRFEGFLDDVGHCSL